MCDGMDNSACIFLWIGSTIFVLIGFTLILYYLRKYFQGKQFKKDIRIDGKIVIITGSNTGIGKITALDLARRGAKVYMACRDQLRCEDARKEIMEKTGNLNVLNRTLDLSSLESIRNFVEQFSKEESRLDILINNAGVMACPRTLTKDGFESQLGVNHMGHFLLTNLLLDQLKSAAPSRIVVVSSRAHMRGEINKNDLNSEKNYSKLKAYSQSKLANVLFTRELAKRLEGTGVTVNCLHPGVVKTELGRHFPTVLRILLQPFVWTCFKTPESGAQTTLHCALEPDLEKVTGKYFSDCKETKIFEFPKMDETAEWLWRISEEWTKLSTTVENLV